LGKDVRVYSFCPCYKDFEGELICLNDDGLIDIDHGMVASEILGQESTLKSIKRFEVGDGRTCYTSVYTYDGEVYCVSQGWKIRIHDESITSEMLEQSIKFYTLGPLEISIDCSSCIYGILLALVISQDQASVKRYLDEFSEKVAMKLTSMEDTTAKTNASYFQTVQLYIMELLENQSYWQAVCDRLKSDNQFKELATLIEKIEQLDRYQVLFYSQVLNIRSMENSRILMRMLSHILKTSKRILDLNNEIHTLLSLNKLSGYDVDADLKARIEEFMNRSRTLDHFFGNITDIMKGSR
jgi:hypothetical protein